MIPSLKIPKNILKSNTFAQNDENDISWLQLIRSENIGPIIFWGLINRFKDINEIFNIDLGQIFNQNKKIKIANRKDVEKEYYAHKKKGYQLIPAYDKKFPQALLSLPDCPPVISVYGNAAALNQDSLCIVGARNSSLSGRQLSEQIASDLVKNKWTVVSGMARGIDEMAHKGALKHKYSDFACPTIAVMAGGVDTPYPLELSDLYHEIAQNGAVISEMSLGTQPLGYLFTRRNRLIAGLSCATVVIEAALKSGSLLTAQFTIDQNKDIFAVPGSPLDPRCRGSNSLLKQGAILIESAQDILSHLNLWQQTYKKQDDLDYYNTCDNIIENETNKEQDHSDGKLGPANIAPKKLNEIILSNLSFTPVAINSLVEELDIALPDLLTSLMDLEIEGKIERISYHLIAIKSSS